MKEIVMPKLTMAMEKGKVEKWLKQDGEEVKEGEPIVEVESEKMVNTINSPETGRLEILVGEGQEVSVGTFVGKILAGGETPSGISGIEAEPKAPEAEIPVNRKLTKPSIHAPPGVKALAEMYGLDLMQIKGTGSRGSITKEDIERTIEDLQLPKVAKVVPLSKLRKQIAERLSRSYNEALHTVVTLEVDMSEIVGLRNELLPEVEKSVGARLTYTAFLVKAVASALKEHPLLNSMLAGESVRIFEDINVGVATAVDGGLLVPVIKNADKKSLSEIALEVEKLAEKAKKGELAGNEISGGTFTISNLGMYGIDIFVPIINPPECAILGVVKISTRAVGFDAKVTIRDTTFLSLSFNHRITDGAEASDFLRTLKGILEDPTRITGA